MATRWQPDTHNDGNPNAPTVELEYVMENDTPVCYKAIVDGVEVDNPQEIFEQILHENQLKNRAVGFVTEWLPDFYKKPELDSDGDPTGNTILKDKFPVQWDFGKLGDGIVSVFVPGLRDEDLEPLQKALQEAFGDTVVYER